MENSRDKTIPAFIDGSFTGCYSLRAINFLKGIKAYKNKDGEAFMFRPQDNFRRFNKSAERMQMPQVPEEILWKGCAN